MCIRDSCLALSLLIWALCLLSALFVAGSTGSLAPALFLFSPLLYAALSLLTAWKNLQTGIWEWTWTFQVSARMVAALQMLCFGGVSVLVCVPANMLLWTFTGQEMPLGWMLALSLASLFLYGALSLLCQRLRGPAGWLAAPTGWVLMGLIPLIWPRTAEWLTAIPTVVFCLLAAAGITPVSYTHLDVYKRQAVPLLPAGESDSSPDPPDPKSRTQCF